MKDKQLEAEKIVEKFNKQIFHYEEGTIGYLMLNRMMMELKTLFESNIIK